VLSAYTVPEFRKLVGPETLRAMIGNPDNRRAGPPAPHAENAAVAGPKPDR